MIVIPSFRGILAGEFSISDILNSQSSPIGNMYYDASCGFRTIFTTDGSDKVIRNEILNSNNKINYNYNTTPTIFTVTFEFKAGGGNGADGCWFYFFADEPSVCDGNNGKYTAPPPYSQNSYRVLFDEYSGNPELAVCWNGYTDSEGILIGSTNPGLSLGNNTWRTAKIQFNNGNFKVFVNGTQYLNVTDSNYSSRNKTNHNFGLGGYIGGLNNFHYFKNFNMTSGII
jgi:hypothetical protein